MSTTTLVPAPVEDASSRPPMRAGLVLTPLSGIAVLILLAVIAGFAYWLGSQSRDIPADNSAEAGFARDMIVHHDQGVEMARLIYDNTDDPAMRLLAFDMLTTQQAQMGQMQGWLNIWGLPYAPTDPPMAWMGGMEGIEGMAEPVDGSTPEMHEMDDMAGMEMPESAARLMPGMATTAEMNQLSTLRGTDADILFLELMIDHHRGGVHMAEGLLARSSYAVVRNMATSIIVAQESEIEAMESLLAGKRAG